LCAAYHSGPDVANKRTEKCEVSGNLRITRIITRLNVGGPSIQAVWLTKLLAEEYGCECQLIAGEPEAGEGDMFWLADRLGVEITRVPHLRRPISPKHDGVALAQIYRLIRRFRPDIVHTHHAKAGFVGRLAAMLARVPVRVHTYHGHVLDGYFSPLKGRSIQALERWMAHHTTRLIAISPKLKEELLNQYRIGKEAQYRLVELGIDLAPYLNGKLHRGFLRRELGCPGDWRLVGIIGRLAEIKNHEMFLRVAQRTLQATRQVGFVVIGGGPREALLRSMAQDLGIASHVFFLQFRDDLPRLYPDLDVVVLTSRNEGTPVSLIEAMAAGKAVLSTRVGGVADLVADGEAGILVDANDEEGMAWALVRLLADDNLRQRLGQRGRAQVYPRYEVHTLAAHIHRTYQEALAEVRERAHGPRPLIREH